MSTRRHEETPAVSSKSIVARVTQLPVVTSALDLAFLYYWYAKDSNEVVRRTLDTAEVTWRFAVEQAKPVVKKWEKSISVVDNLACKALSKLEERYPLMTRTPEEIAHDTKELYTKAVLPAVQSYESARQLGKNTVTAVMDLSLQTAEELLTSQCGRAIMITLSKTLHKADEYLDYYLPPPENAKVSSRNSPPRHVRPIRRY